LGSFFIRKMIEIIGYISAIIIGIILGLIGGGGSILTIPILVYILSIEPILATTYSLFIIGVTSFFGAINNIKKGHIDFKIGLIFTLPSLLSIYFTRRFILPSLPNKINITDKLFYNTEELILMFFAVIMLLSAGSMILKRNNSRIEKEINYFIILIEGLLIGLVTGLVGAGGGFLIIPMLVLFGGLSMKKAIGTSLMIISLKSLIGIIGDFQLSLNIDWSFLLSFSCFSLFGMCIGLYISKFISGEKLKKIFGYLVFFIAVFIFLKELY